ncbi:cupin domain-containing protein [Magnetovibrio blakemorei]|uniref:Aldehyde dehydrogenase n=1 Tax=Magnetovibrio blakemorei TaxID=28181 RepID=A0A1E5Q742_9PROT|nr:cupin domain-containing protein [Magnetovibrio blakemorei]OEJ66755.1 aldehyde dehydrogenase [Magnetovibrio blakemorei]
MSQDINIGARLRQVRRSQGMSQRDLAERSGVTNAMISLIENNRTNPSVGMLKRILDGVPLSLSNFFALADEAPHQVFFQADELTEIADGRISYLQVGTGRAGQSLQILRERYSPGADTGKAMLRHDSQEGGVIIRGRLEVTVGKQKRILGPGDAYYFESRIAHRFRNVSDDECEVVSACTPPSF